LTGHASTPSGTWHLQQGTLEIGSGGSLSVGSLVVSAGSTLSLAAGTSAPIQVSGAVQLSGALKVASLPTVAAGGKITLIHETGTQPVTGTFTGLPHGAQLLVSGRKYTIDYAGGSGHDVVLTASAGATASSTASGSAVAVNVADSSNASGSGGSSILEIAGLIGASAIGASALVLFLRRKKRGAVGRRRRRPTRE